jgi:hypothetical protein
MPYRRYRRLRINNSENMAVHVNFNSPHQGSVHP